ncbi:IPExxxVDY family protein [Sinomicrobium soli]|uniref:IPExxxVDY family protein n=1 Tax=Sinomicrobium sp. N-1-3-6 TaxID=2219864 RepID=UPI000DCBA89D|nr:IPExxxVDY family protein [Sinomicrobium sp. N-1-3-6]RAV28262.1 IPExxxVDY family protein [Sinomicrobium sp. N-1-3-6]
MATLKLSDDFYEPAFSLIAIHCSAEACRLAYFLNAGLGIRLKRMIRDDVRENDLLSEYYEWENDMDEVVWALVVNAARSVVSLAGENLFSADQLTVTRYLVPELKKVDCFLKIDNAEGEDHGSTVVCKINKIPQVTTAYEVDVNQLKSKHNLIF